jgi:hypothetical protein
VQLAADLRAKARQGDAARSSCSTVPPQYPVWLSVTGNVADLNQLPPGTYSCKDLAESLGAAPPVGL